MSTILQVLLVDDSPIDGERVQQELLRAGLAPAMHRVSSAISMSEALERQSWDVVIASHNLSGPGTAEALRLLRTRSTVVPLIVVSGHIGEENAVALIKSGADDLVMMDSLELLAPAVERSLREAQKRLESHQALLTLRESEAHFKAIAANLPGMVFVLEISTDGRPKLKYVSDGCLALFGVPAQELLQGPSAFFDYILPIDIASFTESMQSALRLRANFNWEGRIRVAGSNDIKWVDLRSKARRRDDASVCWEGIVSNITHNKEADRQIRRSSEALARLSAHVETAKERERALIAREIHDELGGTLTAIKLMLVRLGKGLEPNSEQLLQRLQSTDALVDTAMDATRRIATALRPEILDLGIVAALEWQAAEFANRMDMPCQFICAETSIALDHRTAVAMFRILQEALTNVAKHAGATRVEIELEADSESVQMQVHDNGRGIAADELVKPRAFGILGMQERARNIGGDATVRRTRNGTVVTLSLPRLMPDTAPSSAENETPLPFGYSSEPGVPPVSAERGVNQEGRT